MSRAICDGCGRPQSACLCSHLIVRQLPFELVIWQDPDESRHPLSTAPLLQRSSPGAQLLVGDTFSFTDVFGEALPENVALLYPATGDSEILAPGPAAGISKVLVLDGTWRKVRRLLLLNSWLEPLQRMSLTPVQTSRYLRVSPRADGVSTLEAVLMLAAEWTSDASYLDGVGVLDRMAEIQAIKRSE
ncbi:MAG: hypothetical protein CSH36_02505 [Thalassolituus sp.]|nr:MAG: hypothetical protein CSH36_02505 [Thalassolituus sp.]